MVKEENTHSLMWEKKEATYLKTGNHFSFLDCKLVIAGNDYIINPIDFFQVCHRDNITSMSKYFGVQSSWWKQCPDQLKLFHFQQVKLDEIIACCLIC